MMHKYNFCHWKPHIRLLFCGKMLSSISTDDSITFENMNKDNTRNILLFDNEKNTCELFKAAILFAERGYETLYIISKPLDKLPTKELPDKEILKRIVFLYFQSADDVINKLLELHTWKIAPKLLVIPSLQMFFNNPREDIIEKLFLLVASLFNYKYSLDERAKNNDCFSVITFDPEFFNAIQEFTVQTIIDFYYYENGATNIKSLLDFC